VALISYNIPILIHSVFVVFTPGGENC